jgi:tRNA-dihydrouridine synthase
VLFYLAPLEGITGYIVRGAFAHHFPYIDKYFTPFIPAAKRMNKKILRDLSPEKNEGIVLVPQLIGNRADEILMMTEQLAALGFDEINLNFGCPSGTVVAKKRGAGFLSCPDELDRLLDEVLAKSPVRVSVKTRIGMDSPEEWEQLCGIYAKYPTEELIIHPRIQKDFYKNTPRLEAFARAVEEIRSTPLCYNGDINTVADYEAIAQRFPTVDRVMIGRGLLANPGLVGEIRGFPAAEKKQLRAFHDEIMDGYRTIFSGERDLVFHMKEIWFYLTNCFPERDRRLKQIQKCQTLAEYRLIMQQIFG